MIGRKLTARLVADGALNGRPIEKLTLLDVSAPQRPEKFTARVETIAADIADPATARVRRRRPARRRLPSRRNRLRRSRARFRERHARQFRRLTCAPRSDPHRRRRLSAARRLFLVDRGVWRAVPGSDPGRFCAYAAHLLRVAKGRWSKQMLADYTRRGFLDGVGVRLPNIVVRPGKPNKAASGFFSSIIREPLNGEEGRCRSMTACAAGTPVRALRLAF